MCVLRWSGEWLGVGLPWPAWKSEESLQESLLSFHCEGPGDQTQVIRLGGKYPRMPLKQMSDGGKWRDLVNKATTGRGTDMKDAFTSSPSSGCCQDH